MRKDDFTLPKGEIFEVGKSKVAALMSEVDSSADIFDEDGLPSVSNVPGYGGKYQYVPFGLDDQLPFEMIRLIGEDEIMSQNKLFNVLTCYGNGLHYNDPKTGAPTTDAEISRWMFQNSLPEFFLEQATDMKYFFFAVAVIIMSRDGKKIVQVRHKEACYCRFEKADSRGRINHVFYANWRGRRGIAA